jgi:hypothetical protein
MCQYSELQHFVQAEAAALVVTSTRKCLQNLALVNRISFIEIFNSFL